MAEQAYTVASDSETTGEEKFSTPFPEIAIGIDIGTSHCKVAVWNGSQVELLRNTRNQKLLKSYVTFKDEIPAGGVSNQLAHEYEMLSGAAVFNMKRLVGRVDTDPIVRESKSLPFLVQTLDIGARPFVAALVKNVWRSTTPEEVLAIFLVEVKIMAEAHLKRPIRNVVLTIPVSFSRFQLSRIERACAMAGLQVLRLMPEPTAVALLYAQQQQQQNVNENMSSGSEKIAIIFNMGAGFCDVAITATAGGVSQIKALAGTALGGEDILLNLMRHLLPDMDCHFSTRGIDEIRKMGLLRVASQDVIHKLSFQTTVRIDLDLGNGRKIYKVLDRNEFEEMNREVFESCESLMKQCLHDAKVEIEDLNDVILVGGCSSIPMLQNVVMGFCRKELYSGIHPLEAAVRGAALEGAVASGVNDPFGSLDLLTIQVTPLSIGIRANGNNFIPIITKNTTIPARRDMIFSTVHDSQREALIIVFEGDDKVLEKNHLLGYFKVSGIPPAPKGIREISVCMDIDASSSLRVFAGVVMPGELTPAAAFVEVRMPTVDDGHGWCVEALSRTYGSTLELVKVQKNVGYSGNVDILLYE